MRKPVRCYTFDGCADAVFFLISPDDFSVVFFLPAVGLGSLWRCFCEKTSLTYSAVQKIRVFGFSADRLNKTAGAVLFLFPFISLFAGVDITAGICGIFAAVSAVHELYSVKVL